jgi:hypothetical protein
MVPCYRIRRIGTAPLKPPMWAPHRVEGFGLEVAGLDDRLEQR